MHTHPAPVLPPVSGQPFGVSFTADMSDAAAAIGARLADCEPCLACAVDQMTWRYPLVPTAAASLPAELGEGFTPTTTAFSKTIPRYEHEEAYLFVAYLEEDELHDLIRRACLTSPIRGADDVSVLWRVRVVGVDGQSGDPA
ncbi:hypothetical protein [Streptomyces sp. NPDC059349]|uniref:hypothetical protein n=1 Tax=Streptomyces sp. NPDC059349 TaxID=3346808 RepID=UPI0036D0D5E0